MRQENKEIISNNVEDTRKIAKDFLEELLGNPVSKSGATVVGLYGDLGSGKTTFMKYIAEALGVKETVQSPTFVIMKIFELKEQNFKHLIHIDAYRLEKPEELLYLGWKELISHPGNLICIEWPERVLEIMPPHIMVKFEHNAETGRENQRKITEGEISAA